MAQRADTQSPHKDHSHLTLSSTGSEVAFGLPGCSSHFRGPTKAQPGEEGLVAEGEAQRRVLQPLPGFTPQALPAGKPSIRQLGHTGSTSPPAGPSRGPEEERPWGSQLPGSMLASPEGSCVVRVLPAVCTPKEDTSHPPAMFAPHSTLRRLFSKEGLAFPLLSSPNLAAPGVWLKRCFSKERRSV